MPRRVTRISAVWAVLLLRMKALLGAGLSAEVGRIEFMQNRLEITERSTYVIVTVVRVGGMSGEITAVVAPSLTESTAIRGVDYQIDWQPLRWLDGVTMPMAAMVKILDDDVYEEEKRIRLVFTRVEPLSARGVANQEMEIVLKRDDDGGTLVFNPFRAATREEIPDSPECLYWVERVRGSSGPATLTLESCACSDSSGMREATLGSDYEYRPATEEMRFADRETGRRCALWKVMRDTPLPSNESGILVYRDKEVEKNEVACFCAFLGENSTASLDREELRVQFDDLGMAGGVTYTCFRGSECTLTNNVSTSTLVQGDVVYFDSACRSCEEVSHVPVRFQVEALGEVITLQFNRTLDDLDPEQLDICICRNASSQVPITVGTFHLLGPQKSNHATCRRGARSCLVKKLKGDYLTDPRLQEDNTTRLEFLQVLENCQNPNTSHVSLLRSARAAMRNSATDRYVPGDFVFENPLAFESTPAGIYKLCWCRVTDDQNCSSLTDYEVDAGLVVLAGPQLVPAQTGVIGSAFTLSDVFGVGMSTQDKVSIQRRCGAYDEVSLRANTEGHEHTYDFGILQNEDIPTGRYQLCWCQPDIAENVSCNRSVEFRAYFGEVDVLCPRAHASTDGMCERCQPFQKPNHDGVGCAFAFLAVLQAIISWGFGTLAFFSMFSQFESDFSRGPRAMPRLRGRRIIIEDVSPEGPRTMVTTLRPHRLHSCGVHIPVAFFGTGHHLLDVSGGGDWTVSVGGRFRLELLRPGGVRPPCRVDSSMGALALSAPRMLRHALVFGRMPLLPMSIALLLCSMLALVWLESQPGALLVSIFLGVEALLALVLVPCWRLCSKPLYKTSLASRLYEYEKRLDEVNPDPQPCERGPNRAVSATELFTLFDFFQASIKDRTMYYVEPNIIRPLCARHRLSYAERVGPRRVEWFVSHFWGTQFRIFCETIHKHAVSVGGLTERSCKESAYWICTFSNNQYRIAEELGSSHQESSFYLALRSGSCIGTCMVLDELALPLTRSWCLFELLQTIQLEERQKGFQGLLFCTSTGVLNFGATTVELSMNIGQKLATLSLENAEATSKKDKEMINSLVIKEMGGFEAIDRALKERIHIALEKCQKQVDGDFTSLLSSLQKGIALREERPMALQGSLNEAISDPRAQPPRPRSPQPTLITVSL